MRAGSVAGEGRHTVFSLGEVSWRRQHLSQDLKAEKEVSMLPIGKIILGRENGIYKGPDAEHGRVGARQGQLPERTLAALFWMEFPAPRKMFGTKETLGDYYCPQACLNE